VDANSGLFIPELVSLFLRNREGARKKEISKLKAIASRHRWTSETSRYRIQGLTRARGRPTTTRTHEFADTC